MNSQKFTIDGRLAGLNELLKGHWTVRNSTKKEGMGIVQVYATQARIKPVKVPCTVYIHCFEPNKRRDRDNVKGGASKIILDALVNMGVLIDDSPKWVLDSIATVDYNKEKPRIEVEIREVE